MSLCACGQAFRISVVYELLDVGREEKLFDQFLMDVIEIISCIEESVRETADQLIGIVKIAGERIAAGACGNITVKVFIFCEHCFDPAAGKHGSLGIPIAEAEIVARNICPEAGCVTENGRIGTKRKKMIKVVHITAEPPMFARYATPRQGS